MSKKLALIAAVLFALLVAPVAHADRDSYMQYIRDHQINTSVAPEARVFMMGIQACDMMRQGVGAEEFSAPLSIVDVRGIVDAAQHELCPDTLG